MEVKLDVFLERRLLAGGINCEKCDWKHGHGSLVAKVVEVRIRLFRARFLSCIMCEKPRESLIGYRGMRAFSTLTGGSF
jgi:hypothetical protein